MKRALLFVLTVSASVALMARPVDVQRARQMVETYFFSPAVCLSPAEWNELYVFVPAEGDGFVVLAGDDCARPVLAYSLTGRFSFEDMPAHVAAWLDGYRREMADLIKYGATPSPEVQALWQHPKEGRFTPVAPLMTTMWNQSPRYNAMCPYSHNDSAHAVTGCVATAQAQVMKYWNHPAVGHGTHSYGTSFGPLSVDYDTAYQWAQMPDRLSWTSSEAEIHAVAQLMYHVGVAVEMNYGVHSSGAHVIAYAPYGLNYPSTERSLREHFGYNPMLEGRVKAFYSDEVWSNMVRNEIVHGRPVLYSGADETSGHAFVLDGCDSIGMFHVNWGWGGSYDGYYTIDSLSPGAGGIGGNATYTFNEQNTAIFGVRPCYNNDSLATVDLVAVDSLQGAVTGSGVYLPYEDTVTIRVVPAEGYRFDGWSSGFSSPVFTFVPNGDMMDTALFTLVGKDTVSYCDDDCVARWHDDYGASTEWGIRVPPSQRNKLRSLSEVQLFVAEPGYYLMSVYVGESISSETLVLSVQPDLTTASGWTTITLEQPVSVPDDQPVWITFRFTTTTGFPATASFYTAVSDGSWYKLPGGWQPIDQAGVYHSWMIRALFAPRLCHVAVENAGQCELDSFDGMGDYPLGASVTVSCSDPFFSHWDGIGVTDSTITFTVVGDTTFRAYCNGVGIDDVEASEIDQPVSVYDMMGRRVATRPDDVRLLPAGVYLVRMRTGIVKKIVVL
ncbi:MAG: thiol protease/hemagglutinin PrtT [Bacteroidales bacterium]|nr:thiol protease/hemagglutinin PrtT [Bacteroidales bacterium]